MRKLLLLLVLFSTITVFESSAQCAMCRRIAQTNYEQQDQVAKQKELKRGKSLNSGILYLLSIPYILGGVGAFVWWKNKRRG